MCKVAVVVSAGDGRTQPVHVGARLSCWLERTLDWL